MYVMFGDEADADEGRGKKFFLYGGVFAKMEHLPTIHERIEQLRKDAGFGAGDSLKFAVQSKPENVSREKHRDIKAAIIALAEELEMKFCAFVILHAIARTQQHHDLVQFGCNTILGKFNEFLTEQNQHGMVLACVLCG